MRWINSLSHRLFGSFRSTRQDAADRAAWIDQQVRVAASTHRHLLSVSKRGFTAAETPEFIASWKTTANVINQDLMMQWPTLRARSLQLARNNEWAAGYLKQLDDNVLGPAGVRLQMRLRRSSGSPIQWTAQNQTIEEAWTYFCRRGHCDISGRYTFRDLESLALSSLARTGELLYRFRPGAGPHRIQLQMLDPAIIDHQLSREFGSNRIRMGVEIDDDNRPVAYWLQASRPGDDCHSNVISIGRHVRIPAEQIRHFFWSEEVEQLRGIPWLSIGARRLYQAERFEEAAAVASTNSAQRLGFFVSPTGDSPPGFADQIISSVLDAARDAKKVLSPEEIQEITAAAQKYSTTVPGQFDTVPQGYDFRQYDSPWPNVAAGEFVKSQLRGWSSALGAAYNSIGNDLESVNYSSARVGIIAEREHYKSLQDKLISWFHDEIFYEWVKYAVLVVPTMSPSRIDAYRNCATWRPRRWEGIDPVKEAAANESDLRNGLTSRSRIILERSEDPDEIAAERKADDELFGPLSAAEKPANPAEKEKPNDPKEAADDDESSPDDGADGSEAE